MKREIKFSVFFGVVAGLFLAACSSPVVYKPHKIDGKITLEDSLKGRVNSTGRVSAILDNSQAIALDGSIITLKPEYLSSGGGFFGKSDGYAIYSKNCSHIALLKDEQETSFDLPGCPVSASVNSGKLAYVLNDNSFGVIDISSKKSAFFQKGISVTSALSLIPSPLFSGDRVIFPLLDGKLAFLQNGTLSYEFISSSDFFGNVIFLESTPNKAKANNPRIIAATNKRLVLFDGKDELSYKDSISDVLVLDSKIYVLTISGDIIELDSNLNPLRKVNFENAKLSAPIVVGNNLYVLERSSYVIKLDLTTFKPSVYDLRNEFDKDIPDDPVFYNKSNIYYNYYKLDFNRLKITK